MSAPRLTGEQLRRVAYYSVRLESGAPLTPAEVAELQALCTDLTLAAAGPSRAKEPAEQVRARKQRQRRRARGEQPSTTPAEQPAPTPPAAETPAPTVTTVTHVTQSHGRDVRDPLSPSPSPAATTPAPQGAARAVAAASPVARPAAALEGVGGGAVQVVAVHQEQQHEEQEEHDDQHGRESIGEPLARENGAPGVALVVTRQGSEAVKAALLVALHDRGVTAEPEVKLPATSGRSRRPWFPVDVGVRVREMGALVAVVECKPYTGVPGGERQRENYAGCGVPAFACGPGEVPALADFLACMVAAAAAGDPLPAAPAGVTRIPPVAPIVALVPTRPDGPLATVAVVGAQRQAASRRRAALAEFVFAYWQQVHGHPTALLDRRRQKRLEARLAENGDNAHELCYAVDGALRDDWLMGRDDRAPRKYDGIETLFRDRAQVERLATLVGGWRRQDPHPVIVAEAHCAAAEVS